MGSVRFQAHAARSTCFENLKKQLVQHRLASIDHVYQATHIQWAADEASSLAWTTGYPLLLFPALFEERAHLALVRAERQEAIHQRSRQLLGLPSSSFSQWYSQD